MTIRDCISYSYIDGGTKYQGAIAGCADGTVSGCRYVDYGVGGIDNVGYAGLAEPMPYGQEQTAKPQSTGNTCTVTFVVEEEEYQQVRVPFGGSIGTLPEVPNRGDDYWVWDDFDQEHIFSDQTVTGSYHRAATTLASGGDVPQYLVEGVFYEGQELTVSDYEMEESPVSTESFAELIEKNPDIVIVTNELGYGVVPMDAMDRKVRETDGRICEALAAFSNEVHRVSCGLGIVIKKTAE
jgi:adenosylcobinamide kinase/adenosylcobinamide-phosphate guanylyltransferase